MKPLVTLDIQSVTFEKDQLGALRLICDMAHDLINEIRNSDGTLDDGEYRYTASRVLDAIEITETLTVLPRILS